MLRLPYRAGEIVPPEVARLLPPRPAIWDLLRLPTKRRLKSRGEGGRRR